MGRGPLAGDAGAKEEKSHVGVYLENKYVHRTAVTKNATGFVTRDKG